MAMRPNVDLLRKTMDQIREHPELHDQDWFVSYNDCGTAHCFGGWALALTGRVRFTWRDARQVLGLNAEQALTLFSPANTRSILEQMVEDLSTTGDLRSPEAYHDYVS